MRCTRGPGLAVLWRVALACAVLPVFGAALAAPPDEPPDTAAAGEPPPTLPPEQVVRFLLENNSLVMETGLDYSAQRQTVRVAGLPGEVSVLFTARTRQREPRAMLSFSLSHSSGAVEGGVASDLLISVRGGYMQVRRSVRTADEFHSMTFTQSRYRWGREDEGQVALSVRVSRRDTGRAVTEFELTADSMGALLREHPAECVEFLGPLLRNFGQEGAVFSVGPVAAWQVFGASAEPDGEAVRRVEWLVARLAVEDFRERQAAARELKAIAGTAAVVLADRPRKSWTAEQNAWLDAILGDYRRLPPEQAAEWRDDPSFLLRCFAYGDDPAVRADAAREIVRKIAPGAEGPCPLDATADLDGRVKAVGAMRTALAAKP